MSKNLFITGTGTDIGKTYVTALILKKLNSHGKSAAYYKAAMSGNDKDNDGRLIPGDALHVKTVSGISQPLKSMCPYIYETAVSPHLASRIEGNHVDMDIVKNGFNNLCTQYDFVTMEGSGGIICPIRTEGADIFLEDIIKELNLSCILIADAGLGTINDVVLSVSYMHQKNIQVKGIIFNNFHPGNTMEEDNKYMCEKLTGINVLCCVQKGDTELSMDIGTLTSLYE